MKRKISTISAILFCLLFIALMQSCTPTTEEASKTVYVAPIWKGSLSFAPSDPEKGWAYYDTTTGKSYIYDGTEWQIIMQDGAGSGSSSSASDMVYIGESTEEIDGKTYVVKSYADVDVAEPYFYTYYKKYYWDNKLRRLYTFYHGIGSALDYEYTQFREHLCGGTLGSWTVLTYSEEGNIETSTHYSREVFYNYEYTYYENGKMKTFKQKTNGVISSENTYYENGKAKTSKRYTDGVIYAERTLYENGVEQLAVIYNTDGSIDRFYTKYPSGYIQYCYRVDIGYLLSYEDEKTLSLGSNDWLEAILCTPEKAERELEELKRQLTD